MTQVSKIKLDGELQKEMFGQFWASLAKINDSGKSAEFFSDILTETEKIMLAKRFTASVLIIRGKSPTEIRNSIHLSFSAIGNVAAWVKNAKPKTQNLLQSISKEKDWEIVFDKIDEVLDKTKPRRHTDWNEEYAKKRKRNSERQARKSLR